MQEAGIRFFFGSSTRFTLILRSVYVHLHLDLGSLGGLSLHIVYVYLVDV